MEFKLRLSRTVSDLRVVDLALLAESLWCPDCDLPISLKSCHRERRSVFSSTLWVSCGQCKAVRHFCTLRKEDRAKPFNHKLLANAKRLSFLTTGHQQQQCPQSKVVSVQDTRGKADRGKKRCTSPASLKTLINKRAKVVAVPVPSEGHENGEFDPPRKSGNLKTKKTI